MDVEFRMRDMMALRLEDAVLNMQYRMMTDPVGQIVRSLCENAMWMIKDWPGQKNSDMDVELTRCSRLDALGRLRQLMKMRPPRNTDIESLILLLADAHLIIAEQWPTDTNQEPTSHKTLQTQTSLPPNGTQSVHIPPVYTRVSPPKKLSLEKKSTWTVDGVEKTSSSPPVPPRRPPPPSAHRPVQLHITASHSAIRTTPSSQPKKTRSPSEEMDSAKKKPPQVSPFWSFFAKIDEQTEIGSVIMKSRCLLCGKEVSRSNHGTSAMKCHLKSMHPLEYAEINSQTVETSTEPSAELQETLSQMLNDHSAVSSSSCEYSTQIAPAPLFLRDSPVPMNEDAIVKEEVEDGMRYDDETTRDTQEEMIMDNGPSSSSEHLCANNEGMNTPFKKQRLSDSSGVKFAPSPIWPYFQKEITQDKGETVGRCLLCGAQLKMTNYGTTSLWGHLKKIHSDTYNQIRKEKDDVTNEVVAVVPHISHAAFM